ncbi:MAG: hypothetical protein ABWZ08_12670 [Pseudoxanthomonas sp.]
MTRRRRIALLVLAAVIVFAAVMLRCLLDPAFLVPRLLTLAGNSLGLEITAKGESDYRLRGTPQLVARSVVAREPGSDTPVLRADRIFISLPWSTLRARGRDLTAQRLELDAPLLDMAALQRWLAKRPPAETRIPTLLRGIAISRGRILGGDWKIEDVHADIPSLAPTQPLRMHLRGRYVGGSLSAPVDVHATLTEPGSGAGVGIVGEVTLENSGWRLPSSIRLSAKLRSEDGLRLDNAVLGAQSRYVSGDASLPFALGLAGRIQFDGGAIALQPANLALRGKDVVPTLDAAGGFSLTDRLRFDMEGSLAEWPSAWPSLPPPLGQSVSPLPFALAYDGASDLSEVAALHLQRDETVFDGRFRLFELMEWSEAAATGSPLPPLTGTLNSPRLEVSGAVLEGVELQLEDPAIPAVRPPR